MIQLTQKELEIIYGAGWASYLVPILVGVVTGGPIGAAVAVGGVIANAGVDNLQHVYRHHEIPTIGQMINR